MAKCLLGDKIIPVESHWFQWMTNPGWAATISCEEGPAQGNRSGRSLPCPTGSTQSSSGMPTPHAGRSWSFAKHLGGGLGSWFYPCYRLTHQDSVVIHGHNGSRELYPQLSLSSVLSLNRQLRSSEKKKKKSNQYFEKKKNNLHLPWSPDPNPPHTQTRVYRYTAFGSSF